MNGIPTYSYRFTREPVIHSILIRPFFILDGRNVDLSHHVHRRRIRHRRRRHSERLSRRQTLRSIERTIRRRVERGERNVQGFRSHPGPACLEAKEQIAVSATAADDDNATKADRRVEIAEILSRSFATSSAIQTVEANHQTTQSRRRIDDDGGGGGAATTAARQKDNEKTSESAIGSSRSIKRT